MYVLPLILHTHGQVQTRMHLHMQNSTNKYTPAHKCLILTISLAAAQETIMRGLTLESEAPCLSLWWCLPPLPELNYEKARLHKQRKSNFKGWEWFP